MTVEVIRAGALSTVQDLGRAGWAHLGVPRSGALDPGALRLANRLVGNPESAAGLEITLTGCALRPTRATTVAVVGADVDVRVGDRPGDTGRPLAVPAGTTLRIGPARRGLRCWIAVAGGIAVEPVLGSRSTDTLSGLGPAPLRDGDLLPLGVPTGPPAPVDITVPVPLPTQLHLTIRLGPRHDWFTPAALDLLLGTAYQVSPVSNRVGARLVGAPLPRAVTGELPSEGLVLGAVQVPADGQPLIFLADHPATGGYPVVAVVDDVTPLAQARPGTTVRFHGPQR
ncbi:biotin-dependent carboxyltransferase family protein [Micromonospora endophytica]|uniref:Allophanate hydrolase n=1 Tax=Micromonospora endophytica TaxID=515350 RepID=A0A2W2DBW8_9ACTN|nr:biotin-dependent carboxyltransferase family protein [Micromonospora endophytica]PZF97337.1 allophanate hydrolase [Micromonospora endophytica]RIW47656.1 biotin-dependent carboxyltransferase family protein [Micromonospora endophytica]BCJ59321.1 allophanate hydrolase [Micromonospora endophytica]